ncbi:MAG: dTMP kinase [Planctomycetes bacterium]|nr:dTMP kinase [Planctomycetota bacterium]MCB9918118.1 dTMP kinase [Planctomycetota bacterium]
MQETRGVLLAVEGVDGSGKTLQVERLALALRADGHEVVVLREPGGTALGEALREVLLDGDVDVSDPLVAALLFSASRRQLVVEAIAPALARGAVVVLDRSYLSTLVYQGVVGSLDLEFLRDLQRRVLGDVTLDAILLLDIDESTARDRRRVRGEDADSIEARGDDYLARVSQAFRDLAELDPIVHVIDARASVDAVHRECRDVVNSLFLQREKGQEPA